MNVDELPWFKQSQVLAIRALQMAGRDDQQGFMWHLREALNVADGNEPTLAAVIESWSHEYRAHARGPYHNARPGPGNRPRFFDGERFREMFEAAPEERWAAAWLTAYVCEDRVGATALFDDLMEAEPEHMGERLYALAQLVVLTIQRTPYAWAVANNKGVFAAGKEGRG